MKDLTDSFQALKDKQQLEADRLSEQAGRQALKVLSPATVIAATRLLERVTEDRGQGGLGEPAQDLRDIRSDSAFNAALMRDLRTATEETRLFAVGAVAVGYKSQIEGTKLNGAKLIYRPDEQSRKAIDSYPIMGETAAEHAAAITDSLRRDVLRAVGLPITGQADATQIITALAAAADAHSKRVSSLVGEAFFAGVQAGLIDASKALTT